MVAQRGQRVEQRYRQDHQALQHLLLLLLSLEVEEGVVEAVEG